MKVGRGEKTDIEHGRSCWFWRINIERSIYTKDAFTGIAGTAIVEEIGHLCLSFQPKAHEGSSHFTHPPEVMTGESHLAVP